MRGASLLRKRCLLQPLKEGGKTQQPNHKVEDRPPNPELTTLVWVVSVAGPTQGLGERGNVARQKSRRPITADMDKDNVCLIRLCFPPLHGQPVLPESGDKTAEAHAPNGQLSAQRGCGTSQPPSRLAQQLRLGGGLAGAAAGERREPPALSQPPLSPRHQSHWPKQVPRPSPKKSGVREVHSPRGKSHKSAM